MSSKTSSSDKLFSKAIIKADLRNHWAWPVIAGVLMLFNLFTTLNSYSVIKYFERVKPPYSWLDMVERLLSEYYFTLFLGIAFSFLLGAKLFFYLDKINSVSCMHGMPFTRKKLFLSHVLSGGILVMSPAVVITVLMMLLKIALPDSLFRIDICLMFLAGYAVYTFIAFAISAFTMTVSGNVIVSLGYSVCIVVLPISVVSFVEYLFETQIYGYVSGGFVEKVVDYLYLLPYNLFPWRFIIYIILGIGLYIAAYFVYKVRPLENCEEVMAFRKFRWFFIALVGFVLGMISYVFFVDMLGGESILWMLPLGLVGTVAASMFARKSLSLKGSVKYVVIYVLLALMCSACLKFDLTGYERRIPSASSVESVYIDYSNRNYYYYEYANGKPDYLITDPDEIELVRQLHKAYVSEKGNSYNRISYNGNIYRNDDLSIEYKLKNGLTLKRRYYNLSGENFDKYFKPVLDTRVMKSQKYPLVDDIEKEILNITVYDNRIDTPAVTYTTKTELKKLEDALIYDIEHNSYSEMNGRGALSLSIEYYVPGSKQYGGAYPTNTKEKYEIASNFNVQINENFTRTLAALEEIGYEINNKEEMAKIDKLAIYISEYEEYLKLEPYSIDDYTLASLVTEAAAERAEAYERGERKIVVTDKNDIDEFYKLCGTGFISDIDWEDEHKVIECVLVFYNNDGEEKAIYDTGTAILVKALPANLQKYFK